MNEDEESSDHEVTDSTDLHISVYSTYRQTHNHMHNCVYVKVEEQYDPVNEAEADEAFRRLLNREQTSS